MGLPGMAGILLLNPFIFDPALSMLIRFLSALLLLACTVSAHAGLVIQGSRIIYYEGQGETSVNMQYVGDAPTLLQAWIDVDEQSAPGEGEVPFILMPAVARLDPGNGQTIRILRTRDGLPQDRESLFYFNTLEVPPAPTAQMAAGETFMQFSIRGQFKLFYRPKGLKLAPEKAIELLRFSMAEPDEEGRMQVQVANASPYHVTFSTLALRAVGADASAPPLLSFGMDAPFARMVAPMGTLVLPLQREALSAGMGLPDALEVNFTIINDGGGLQSRTQRIG